MSDEVEVVARALCASNQDIWTNGPADWAYLDDARAAIDALDKVRGEARCKLVPIVPTPVMINAAANVRRSTSESVNSKATWLAMIAAAPQVEEPWNPQGDKKQ